MTTTLSQIDPEVAELITAEEQRQRDNLRLIASENYASQAVMEASGSVLTNKYSEGYPGVRYYQGQEYVDQMERLANKRLRKLFGCEWSNVQPYSGSPANLAVYLTFCQPGDTIMGLGLPAGGHLTHGWTVSISGKYFNSIPYGVTKTDHRIDFASIRSLAKEHRPKLIFCGATAYPRTIDFATFREIADEVDAILVADIAHIAGLVAAGAHPTPVGTAQVITSTTHKTFRGPRGGMILCDKVHAKPINRAVFPGLQGGPHNHTTAGIAVAAKEAATPEFKIYGAKIVENAKALGEGLVGHGFSLVTGGTDNHLVLADLTPKGVGGKPYAQALEKAGIVCNYNSIPFDPRKPMDPSGIRLGTAALTTRGMGTDEMTQIAGWMNEVAQAHEDGALQSRIAGQVKELCASFPAPGLPQA